MSADFQPVTLNTAHLKGYWCNESLLVWQQLSDTLHLVEGIGIWALLGLDQGLTPSELFLEYQSQYPDQSIQTIEPILQSLAHFFEDNMQAASAALYIEEFAQIRHRQVDLDKVAKGFFCSINNVHFQVLTNNRDLLEEITRLFVDCLCATFDYVDYRFTVEATDPHLVQCNPAVDSSWRITCNGIVLREAILAKHVLPILIDYIQIAYYQSIDYLIAIHAAGHL